MRRSKPRSEKVLRTSYRIAVLTLILWAGTGVPFTASAAKILASGGMYSFTAENERNSTSKSLSGLGTYCFQYQHQLQPSIALDLGYSLLATQIVSGDLSFGFDIGATYFPFTSGTDIRAEVGSNVALLQEVWRPFVGIAFHQRNFQSTSSQYAGAGIKFGTEYQWHERISLIGTIRYISLGGPNKSSATQIDMMGGIAVQF